MAGVTRLLVSDLVPGYVAVMRSHAHWKPEWSQKQRAALWISALGSTAAPDLHVMYNTVFQGFCGHTILLTYNVLHYVGLALIWWLLRRTGRVPYVRTMTGLIAAGGLSHVFLNVVAHGTSLLYSPSMHGFGSSWLRMLERGLIPYLKDPVFLLEPFLIGLAVARWLTRRDLFSGMARMPESGNE